MVKSVTLVGSFCSSPGVGGISDIDTIVVVDKLNKTNFDLIKEVAEMAADPALIGLPEHSLHINSSFGPLKFDTPNSIVLHLMIYDIEGHRKHVLESPFTCYDWERSAVYFGETLKEIYPVLKLQPSHFSNARRGLADYLKDIEKGSVGYRKYEFSDVGEVSEKKHEHVLDARHKGEYAYHIIYNLLLNFAKLIHGENLDWRLDELCSFWRDHLSITTEQIPEFIEIARRKREREEIFPETAIPLARDIIHEFTNKFENDWGSTNQSVYLVRHGPTDLNDGSFLGQGRNPPLTSIPSPYKSDCATCFSSPLLRAMESAIAWFPDKEVVTDSRLLEIDYGKAEGLNVSDLARQFPSVIEGWNRGFDSPFPGGESSRDVLNRFLSFLESLSPIEGPIWAFTHNVVIRVAIGHLLSLPMQNWHRIPVEHLEPIELKRYRDRYYLNLNKNQRARITDQIIGI
jgi:broad specificity phosphatase PhoE